MKNRYKSAIIVNNKGGVKVLKVIFPYAPKNVVFIKDITGRIYDVKGKFWTIPLTLENCLALNKENYLLSDEIKEWAKNAWSLNQELKKPLDLKGFKANLRPYQEEGVKTILKFQGRALLADDMGLGKTIQALAWLHIYKEMRPAIVVCPASLKINWFREAMKFMDDPNVQILEGTKPYEITGDLVIINYDVVYAWGASLLSINPKVIIMDEMHYAKTPGARRSKALAPLCSKIPNVLGITGTPIEKGVSDIFNPLKLINSTIFPNKWKFQQRYCAPKHNGFGWDFSGASNVEELHELLTENIMIRRKKTDVLKELPDKIYSFIPLEIDNRKEYEEAENDFIEYVQKGVEIEARELMAQLLLYDQDTPIEINDHKLARLKEEKGEKASHLAQLEALKQLAVKGKMKAIYKWVDDFLESGEKLVLFCEHVFVIEELLKYYSKCAVAIYGGVSGKKRDAAVQAFQNNKNVKLFIGNKAAEVGLTLTASSNIAIMEWPWLPGPLAQRIDRVHRIGQEYVVGVYYLMAVNTIEEKIAKNLDKAQRIIDGVIDGIGTDKTNLLGTLINDYKRR